MSRRGSGQHTPAQSSAGFELGGTGSTTTQGVDFDFLRDRLKDDPCIIHSIKFLAVSRTRKPH